MKNNKNKNLNTTNKQQNENKSQNMPKSDNFKNEPFGKNVGSDTQKNYSSNQPKEGFQKKDSGNTFGSKNTSSDTSKKSNFKK